MSESEYKWLGVFHGLLFVVIVLMLTGCNEPYKATTVVKIDPMSRQVYYQNDKDMDLTIKGLKANVEAKTVELEELTLANNASSVMGAYALMMKEYNEEFRIHGQNIVNGLREVVGPLQAAMSLFTGIPPSGAVAPDGVTVVEPVPIAQNPTIKAIAKAIAEAVADSLVERLPIKPEPTTQPVE